jgi:MoaA/NifB/PqqE/SkfB family radical SAM enzyme
LSAHLPAPRRVTVVANPDACNLACDMCREHAPAAAARRAPPRALAPEAALALLASPWARGLEEVIPSTMGEPLLWSGMEPLVRACAARRVRVNVTTNGTWPGRGAEAWAELLAPAASDVKVSWNAATAGTARAIAAGLDLARAEDALRAFVAVRDRVRRAEGRACGVSLQVTAREANVAELPAIVALAARLGLERVKVNQLQVHFPALAGEDLRRSAASRARWNEAVRLMRAAAAAPPRKGGGALALAGAVEWPERGEPAARGPCPFLGREAWVLWDGRFAPCPSPAAWDGALGEFGPAGSEAWESAAYRALVDGYEAREACRACAFRRVGGV